MSIVIVSESSTTRRNLCEDCDHCRMVDIPKPGVPFVSSSDDMDELPTCSLRYHMTCQLRAALGDKAATCPHPDAERAVRWNAAACDQEAGCADRTQADDDAPGIRNTHTPRPVSPLRGFTTAKPFEVHNGERHHYD